MSIQLQTQTKTVPTASFIPVPTSLLQRKCACGQHTVAGSVCAECRQKREWLLQRAAVNAGPANSVPPIVHEVLNSPGQPLDAGTQAFMSPRFGYDFSRVRVHTDAKAVESARAVNALAYTVGRDVVFETGQYAPATMAGRALLAHELVHTIQQGTPGEAKLATKRGGDSITIIQDGEIEADQAAPKVVAGRPVTDLTDNRSAPLLQRQVHGRPAVSVRSPALEEAVTLVSDIQAANTGRPLLSSEIALARQIFADSIDYSKVRLLPTQIAEYTTVANNIRVSKDFTISTPWMAETLIHEMTHVWQYQHGGTSYISISLAAQIAAAVSTPSRNFAYDYQLTPGKSFFSFLPEQQGLIVQNYFAMLRDKAEPFGVNRYRANHLSMSACAMYGDCFPRLLWNDRQAEITQELPLHESLIRQMRAALTEPEVNILSLRAGEVMQTPHEELVPKERQLTPLKPILDVRF